MSRNPRKPPRQPRSEFQDILNRYRALGLNRPSTWDTSEPASISDIQPRRPPRQLSSGFQEVLDMYRELDLGQPRIWNTPELQHIPDFPNLWEVPDVPADERRVEARPKQPVLIDLTVDSPQKRVPSAPVTSEPHISCAICLGSPLEQRPSATPCGHVFCHSCIIQAIKHTRMCPVCRKPVSEKNVLKLHI